MTLRKRSNGFLFQAIVLVLSSYIGVFFAYIIQQSYQVFSYSVELSSYISAYKLQEYYDGAYQFIKECYGFSDQNLWIIVFGSVTFISFVVLLNYASKSFEGCSQILLRIIAYLSIAVWLIEPLIVMFSSLENPNISYMIGWGKIPDSDVAVLSRTIVQLDRFRLFSRSFFFSFRSMVFATFILLSALSFPSLFNRKAHLLKKFLIVVSLISPFLTLWLFSFFSPSMIINIFYGSGDFYIVGVGDIYLGLIVRPFLENLRLVLSSLLIVVWVAHIFSEVISQSKKSKSYVMKAVERLRLLFREIFKQRKKGARTSATVLRTCFHCSH